MGKKYLSHIHIHGTQLYVCEVWEMFFGYMGEDICNDFSSGVQEWICLQIAQYTRKHILLSDGN